MKTIKQIDERLLVLNKFDGKMSLSEIDTLNSIKSLVESGDNKTIKDILSSLINEEKWSEARTIIWVLEDIIIK